MSDPKRLLEGGEGDLAKLLSAGKSEIPDAAQLGALAAKIGIVGGAGTSAGAAGASGAGGVSGAGSAAAAAAVKTGVAMKIGGAAVVVATAAASTAIVATSTSDAPPRTPVGIVAMPSSSADTSPGASTVFRLTEPPQDPSSAAPPPPAPTSSVAGRPAASAVAEGPAVEVRLLERAQDALRSRPAEALALADDHARRFPRGMLVQEREVIAIEALVKAGRVGEAKARAARFKERFPGSSHTRRVDALVGE